MMPRTEGAEGADGAEGARVAQALPSPLLALPPTLWWRIFSRVPVDVRLRCAEVCPAWRDTLRECSVWTRLDLSPGAGLARPATDALLRAAAAKAGGGLEALDVYDCDGARVSYEVLLEVVAANATTLVELRANRRRTSPFFPANIKELLVAAPQLHVLEADVDCAAGIEACRMLRNDGMYVPLRLRRLSVCGLNYQGTGSDDYTTSDDDDAASDEYEYEYTPYTFVASLSAHASLTSLTLEQALLLRFEEDMDAVVDAVIALRLRELELLDCSMDMNSPWLVRLLQCTSLVKLTLSECDVQYPWRVDAAVLLGDALQRNSTLTSLTLGDTGLWHNMCIGVALMNALVAHPSLRELRLVDEKLTINSALHEEDMSAIGATLFALVAANAPALQLLALEGCRPLGDAALAPLLDALPRNTHLRHLACAGTELSESFARDKLLPAVRANSSLRELVTGLECPAAREAEAIVRSRIAVASACAVQRSSAVVMQAGQLLHAVLSPPPSSATDVGAWVHSPSPLLALPSALWLRIFSRVPVDVRLRCAEVCPAWRDTLRERSLWTRLDISPGAGLAHPATDALLRAAAAKAGGGLEALDVSTCLRITTEAVLAVITSNAGALRELRGVGNWSSMHLCVFFDAERDAQHPDFHPGLETLLHSAPNLTLLEADVMCPAADAVLMLRNEGQFRPMRLRQLDVIQGHGIDDGELSEQSLFDIAANLSAHPWLTGLMLPYAASHASVAAGMHAVIDAIITSRLHTLCLGVSAVSPAAAPALVRVLGSSALTSLHIEGDSDENTVLDAPAAALLGNALRSNCTLTNLCLDQIRFWDDAVAAAKVLNSMVAHPSLRILSLNMNSFADKDDAACAGASLFALVVADAPALHELKLTECYHSDALLAPLMVALPRNTHLRRLECGGDDLSEQFARERLLPAVRANSSLREFGTWEDYEAVREVKTILRSRAGH
jgi:hypothetical protein